MASELTTIQISKMTRDPLHQLGMRGETYDQVLHRFIEPARKAGFFKGNDRILETVEFVHLEQGGRI